MILQNICCWFYRFHYDHDGFIHHLYYDVEVDDFEDNIRQNYDDGDDDDDDRDDNDSGTFAVSSSTDYLHLLQHSYPH